MPAMNVVVGSRYLWRGSAKVGLHYLCEHLLRSGCQVDWFTVPLSLLHGIKPRIARVKRPFFAQSRHPEWETFAAGLINHVPLTVLHAIPGWPILGGAGVARNYWRLRWRHTKRMSSSPPPCSTCRSIAPSVRRPGGSSWFTMASKRSLPMPAPTCFVSGMGCPTLRSMWDTSAIAARTCPAFRPWRPRCRTRPFA